MEIGIFLVVALAAFVQGYSGFGFGLVSMSLFALLAVDLEYMSAVVTVDAAVVLGLLLVLSRHSGRIRWRQVGLVCLGGVLSMPLGYALLAAFKDHSVFRMAVGVAIFGFGLHGLAAPSAFRKLGRIWGIGLGAVGGFISGAMVSGGPPIVLYFYSQAEDARDLKASLQTVFLILTGARCLMVGVHAERYGWDTLQWAVFTVPVAACFLVAGHVLAKRVTAGTFRRVVFALLCLSGGVNVAWIVVAKTL